MAADLLPCQSAPITSCDPRCRADLCQTREYNEKLPQCIGNELLMEILTSSLELVGNQSEYLTENL